MLVKRAPACPSTIPGVILLLLVLCLTSCTRPVEGDARDFLLRSDSMTIAEVSAQLLEEINTRLSASPVLTGEYPLPGRIHLEPDSTQPGAETMSCVPDESLPANEKSCLLLNPRGDFLKTQAVTWESAAFFMYRVYVIPDHLFASANPVKDFVALDVFLLEAPELWETVDQAIRASAIELGARPYSP